MRSPRRFPALALLGLASAGLCSAQFTISAHSGLVQMTLGSVYLDDQPVHKTTTNNVEMKAGQVLRTEKDGSAEVLLTPGVFLRMGGTTAIRLDANALANTRVTVLKGVAMVECDELLEGNAVAFTVANRAVEIRKKGLFRLDADSGAVAAIKGEVYVASDVNQLLKQGRFLDLNTAAPEAQKFKVNKKDDLYAFSKARSEDSAYATGVTSSSLYATGFNGCTTSSWYYMGAVGMYSYLPCRGILGNPFGYSFLGLSSGYMWDGPGYYAAPYALYAPYRGYAGRGAINTGGTAAAGAGQNPHHQGNGLLNGTTQHTPVPVYGVAPRGGANAAMRTMTGPGMAGSGGGHPAAMRSMAGPSIQHAGGSAASGGGGGWAARNNGGGGSPAGAAHASAAGGTRK